MARLPIPGKDPGTWGDILNDYLSQTHNSDGSLKDNAVTANVLAPNSVTNAAIADNAVNAANIANSSITEALLDTNVQTKLNASGGPIISTDITDSTAAGRSLLTATDATAARTAIGAGTSNLALGTTGSTAKAGNYQPASADIADATVTGRSLLTAADVAAAKTTLSLTKSDIALGNVDNTSDATKNSATATLTNKTISGSSNSISNIAQSSVTNLVSDLSGKAATAHTHTATNISDSTPVGRAVLTAADAAAARSSLSAARVSVFDVRDYGADASGVTTATSSFHTAFATAIAAGGTVSTPAGLYKFDTQIVVPAGLKWILDPNAILVKNFSGTTGDRRSNCLIRNTNAPANSLLVADPGEWTPSTFDDDIQIIGGRIRIDSSLVGGGFYLLGVRRLLLKETVVEHSRADWAYTIGATDSVLDRIRVEDNDQTYEDGLHFMYADNVTVIEPYIVSGDDSIAFGANYNTAIKDVDVRGGTLISRRGNALGFWQYRVGSTAAFAPPTKKLENIRVRNVKAKSGIYRNGILGGTTDYITGTAQAGSSTTVTLAATASPDDGFYTGCRIVLTGGTGGSGQLRYITGYVGSTKVVTVGVAFTPAPDGTTTYSIAGALAKNIDISGEFVAGDMSGHDGVNPNGMRLVNMMDVKLDTMVRNSIRESYYFEDILGKLELKIRNSDPQETSASYYGVQIVRCPNVTLAGALTRSVTHVVNVVSSNVIATEFLAFNLSTGNGFRLTSTSGYTTQLTAGGSTKFVRAPGATLSRVLRCDSTGSSYALRGCDLTECDQMVFDNATPAVGIIDGIIPTSKQIIGATVNSATPSVRGAKILTITNTVATTITDLSNGYDGQTVEVHFTDAFTTVDFTASILKGNAGVDWVPASGDTMLCTKRSASWYCRISKNV